MFLLLRITSAYVLTFAADCPTRTCKASRCTIPNVFFSAWVELVIAVHCIDAQETNESNTRLKSKISTDGKAAASSAYRLWRDYLDKYPSDPVSDDDFALLVTQLRPAADIGNMRASALADDESNAAVMAQSPAQAPVSEARNDSTRINPGMRDESRGPEPLPNYKLLELIGVWKQHFARIGTPTRSLNVLNWGLGE